MSHIAQNIIVEGSKAGPSLAVLIAWFLSIDLDAITKIAALILICMQIGWWIWKYIDKLRGKKSED